MVAELVTVVSVCVYTKEVFVLNTQYNNVNWSTLPPDALLWNVEAVMRKSSSDLINVYPSAVLLGHTEEVVTLIIQHSAVCRLLLNPNVMVYAKGYGHELE